MPLTRTTITVKAAPVTAHRLEFPEIYEETGEPYTSVWYDSYDEAIRSWARRGFTRVETADMRVHELKKVVDQLQRAFDEGGSEAVTLELARIQREHAEDDYLEASADIDMGVIVRDDFPIRVAYERALYCDTFRDPENDDWLIAGLSMMVLFDHEFPPSRKNDAPAGSHELQSTLRVSFDRENGLQFHPQESTPKFSVHRYLVNIESSPAMFHAFEVEQSTFESILERHKDKFSPDTHLQSGSYEIVRGDLPPARTRLRSPELLHDLAWWQRASGQDDEYMNQWTTGEWEAWSKSMRADPDGDNPELPDWVHPLIRTRWYGDFSVPFPQLAELFPTEHNWFQLADEHPEFELFLEDTRSEGFELNDLRAAYEAAKECGWTPLLTMHLIPMGTQGTFAGAIEAFHVVAPEADSEAVEALLRKHNVPHLSTSLVAPYRSTADLIGRDATGLVTWASEWMYV